MGLIGAFQTLKPEAQTIKEEITTSGTWTVPNGVYEIHIMCIGGGGSGAYGVMGNIGLGGGGGYLAEGDFDVTPGTNLTVTIGAGGTKVTSQTGNNGGATSVTYNSATLLSAAGGEGGQGRNDSPKVPGHAGNGGTGGGSAVVRDSGSTYEYPAGNGQYGGCGGSAYSMGASNGQGTRTALGGKAVMDRGGPYVYGGGGGGGMNGGNGGDGAAISNSSNSAAAGGGGGGYGTTKKAGDGKMGTVLGGKGGTGYGAGGGGGAYWNDNAGYAGAGAPGICVITYSKGVTS